MSVSERAIVYAYDRRSERCRRMESTLASTLQKRLDAGRTPVLRLEWSEHRTLARRLGVVTVPSVLVVERGRVVARLDGPAVSSRELDAFVGHWFDAAAPAHAA